MTPLSRLARTGLHAAARTSLAPVVALTLGSALVAASAALPAPLAAQAVPRIAVTKYTLPNGLEVILHEDHTTPIVAGDTWFHVGSGDE